jgi:cob(I)alamin adenosyltransferase
MSNQEVGMARIYTKTGDDGTTGLLGGVRISKDSPRIRAYGSLDELNALLGVISSYPLAEPVRKILRQIQDDLFTVGAILALPEGTCVKDLGIPGITDTAIQVLESEIDECAGCLPPLDRFILPGGSTAGAMLHLARTVARRAERRCVALALGGTVPPEILRYMNRLSDLLFVLARLVNHQDLQPECHPTFGKP